MGKCENCERPLKDSEETFCPACQSDRSRNAKLWTEILGGIVGLGSLAWYMLSGSDDDEDDDDDEE